MRRCEFEKNWQGFADAVLKGCTPEERNTARDIFYAGGALVLIFFTKELRGMSNKEAIRSIDDLSAEFVAFMNARKRHTEH